MRLVRALRTAIRARASRTCQCSVLEWSERTSRNASVDDSSFPPADSSAESCNNPLPMPNESGDVAFLSSPSAVWSSSILRPRSTTESTPNCGGPINGGNAGGNTGGRLNPVTLLDVSMSVIHSSTPLSTSGAVSARVTKGQRDFRYRSRLFNVVST